MKCVICFFRVLSEVHNKLQPVSIEVLSPFIHQGRCPPIELFNVSQSIELTLKRNVSACKNLNEIIIKPI